MLQALVKAGKTEDRVDDYVLVEDVQKGWDRQETEKPGLQRILDWHEKVLHAQDKWKGAGKFVLRKKSDVSVNAYWREQFYVWVVRCALRCPRVPWHLHSPKFILHTLCVVGFCEGS